MKRIIIIIAAIIAICAAALGVWLYMQNISEENPYAEIYLDGKLYRRLPLSDDCEIVIETEKGSNTVTISAGKVAVTEADCPDKICVRTGWIDNSVVPIVCLPHRVEVRVVSANSEVDAIA